jgi:hypothetical protein
LNVCPIDVISNSLVDFSFGWKEMTGGIQRVIERREVPFRNATYLEK